MQKTPRSPSEATARYVLRVWLKDGRKLVLYGPWLHLVEMAYCWIDWGAVEVVIDNNHTGARVAGVTAGGKLQKVSFPGADPVYVERDGRCHG